MLTLCRIGFVLAGVLLYAIAINAAVDHEYGASLVLAACGFGAWLYGCSDGLADTIEAHR